MRILFLAGGSGGHIVPALAIATEVRNQKPSAEIFFVCSRSNLDQEILQKSGERYQTIFTGKLRRYFDWRNFIDPFFLILGFFQSLFFLIKFKPDVVFSKGGFVSVPPVLAAALLRIPIYAHESDAVPGLANRITQKFAKKIFTAFESNFGEWVGLPIRSEIFIGDAEKGKKFLNFPDSSKPIIFGFFGSQGSQKANELFFPIAEKLAEKANVVWVTGKSTLIKRGLGDLKNTPNKGACRDTIQYTACPLADTEPPLVPPERGESSIEGGSIVPDVLGLCESPPNKGDLGGLKYSQNTKPPSLPLYARKKSEGGAYQGGRNIHLFPYLHTEFPDILATADLVIARSGSGIFEVAAAKKPAILLPLSISAGKHQEKNARYFEEKKAAIVLNEQNLSSNEFLKEILKILKNESKREEMSENIEKLVKRDAAEKIAKEIIFHCSSAQKTGK